MNSSVLLDLVLWLVLCLDEVNFTQGGMIQENNINMEEDSQPLRRYDADLVDCQNISEIVFLGFFPCLRQNGSGFEVSTSISECDLLAETAAHLAVERVNQDQDVLPNITLKLYPIYVPSKRVSQADEGYYDILVQILNLLQSNDSENVWGVIGPGDDPSVADLIAPISENSGLITVTYGSTSKDSADKVSTFYRTLPSERSANYGRLVLLARYKWYRIGILMSSKEEHYFKESSHFLSVFNHYVEKGPFNKINLDLTESFEYFPSVALRKMKSRDINIIVGFFGPENARRVLCQANSLGLVSAEHAWVLPSYYDPNWWRSTLNSTDCSNEEMKYILESVIFVDTIKLPPVELTVQDFYSKLLIKTTKLHPSLTEEDLKPYLLHSKATSAYDAVTLLARSVGVAFDLGGDSCIDTSVIQVVLDQAFLACEYCQLFMAFANCFNLSMLFEKCEDCYGSTSFTTLLEYNNNSYLNHHFNGSKSDYLLDFYGQILYSQFQDGEECPIILWWPGLGEEDYKKGYTPISDFDEDMTCISRNVTLSRRDFISNSSKCLKRFDWRGSSSPPSSRFLEVVFIPIGGLVTIGMLVLSGQVAAILLVVFNVLWRRHKIVKATSPYLNVVLLFGIMIRLPSTLYFGLVISASHYPNLIGKDLTLLCHVNLSARIELPFGLWQYYIGDALFVATLIAKNWRIYRIFYNKGLKQRGDKLANDALMIGVALAMLPLSVILSVWSAKGIHFHIYSFQNENLQIIKVTSCYLPESIYFEFATNSYILILLIFLFILSLLSASVPSANFRREGVVTYKAVVIALLPTPSIFLLRIGILLSQRPELFVAQLWAEFCWTSLLPFILLVVLFAPTICAVLRRHVEEKQASSEEKVRRYVTLQYNDLRHTADALKVQLNQLDNDILKIKTDLASRVANSSDRHGMSKTEQCTSEADVPNIDDADVTSVSDKVDLTIVPESTNKTKFVAIDYRKHETGEVSDSDAKLYHTASETVVSPTDPLTEAILMTNNSTAFDGGSPSPSSQTAVSAVRINYPCPVQTENTKDSEVYNGHIDLCTSLDHTKNTLSSESSHSVTSNEVNVMTILSGPSKGDKLYH